MICIAGIFPGSELAARHLPLVLAVLEQHPGVTLADVVGPSHKPAIADARHHLIYELYELGLSLPAVGRLVGRHHTTVMDSRRRWARIVGDVGPLPSKATLRAPVRHPSTVHGGML